MMTKFQNIAIYGGGSWGSALSIAISKTTDKVILFLRNQKIIEEISNNKTNKTYLGNIKFPQNILASNNLDFLKNQEILIIAVPSSALLKVIEDIAKLISEDTILVIATKGLIGDPPNLISNKIKDLLKNKIAFLAGPNFSHEVANNLLTHANIACLDLEIAKKIAHSISSENFIVSAIDDVVTLQVAGIIKNIIAIKSGIYDALGHGENAMAALISDGMKEIRILSETLGGKSNTLLEYSVLGDLTLTCSSKLSRNRKFGYEFQKQHNKPDFLLNYPYLVEGIQSTKLIMSLIKKYNLHLPIVESVFCKLNITTLVD